MMALHYRKTQTERSHETFACHPDPLWSLIGQIPSNVAACLFQDQRSLTKTEKKGGASSGLNEGL